MSLDLAGVVLYVRSGCHLCELFLLEMSLDLGEGLERLRVLDVDSDETLASRYGLRVPVLEARGEVLCEGVYDRARVLEALRV